MKTATLSRFWFDYHSAVRYKLKPRTIAEYRRLFVKLIEPEFGRRKLSTLTLQGIERWHGALAQATPYQANRALAVLSAMLSKAAKWGAIPVNPAKGVSYVAEKNRQKILTGEQARRFLDVVAELEPEEGAYLLVLFYTGARPGELLAAYWDWIVGDQIQLPDSKTGQRVVYLPHAALVALSAIHPGGELPEGLIFPNINHTVLWRKVRRRAKLDGVRLYDLRHTFASAALAGGEPLEAISQVLGHSNPRTTRRYVQLMPGVGVKTAESAVRTLESYAGEEP